MGVGTLEPGKGRGRDDSYTRRFWKLPYAFSAISRTYKRVGCSNTFRCAEDGDASEHYNQKGRMMIGPSVVSGRWSGGVMLASWGGCMPQAPEVNDSRQARAIRSLAQLDKGIP